jgi:hypothetical protein
MAPFDWEKEQLTPTQEKFLRGKMVTDLLRQNYPEMSRNQRRALKKSLLPSFRVELAPSGKVST